MAKKVLFKGTPLTLMGRNLKINSLAPNFKVTSNDMQEVTLTSFQNKVKVITSFISLDTPVCDLQVKEFNKKAASQKEVAIIGISKDLPFAQKRFCESFKIANVHLLSDYKNSSFAINYGLLIKEWNLVARAVLIVDKSDVVRYIQIVDEITAAPNYDDVLKNLAIILKNPTSEKPQIKEKCEACEGIIAPLSQEVLKTRLKNSKWELLDGKKISREFTFKNFAEGKFFLDVLSAIAEEEGHHPSFFLTYTKLKVTLSTHAANGITENDLILAKIFDEVLT